MLVNLMKNSYVTITVHSLSSNSHSAELVVLYSMRGFFCTCFKNILCDLLPVGYP